MIKNYEAWDFNKGVCIYTGTCRPALVTGITEYVESQNNVELHSIDKSDISTLNNQALKYAGIQIYII
ncbi:hypothetical protein [Sporosarcina sp. FSL K6-1508]|uniref:hypothetical protein n=1 Tax=Sporosarcina sp. FSL K6-1508 TaxID=2921553 RepID=UPI0030F7076A